MAPLISGWEWFPEKKGLVSGIMIGGYGFSTFVFSWVSTQYVNAEDAKPSILDPKTEVAYFDKTVSNRVPGMLRHLAMIYSVLLAVSVLLMDRRTKITQSESQRNKAGFKQQE